MGCTDTGTQYTIGGTRNFKILIKCRFSCQSVLGCYLETSVDFFGSMDIISNHFVQLGYSALVGLGVSSTTSVDLIRCQLRHDDYRSFYSAFPSNMFWSI